MTPKEYLQQYRHAVERARSALEHLQELQTMATRTTPIYGGECGREFNDDGVCTNIDKYPAYDDCEE